MLFTHSSRFHELALVFDFGFASAFKSIHMLSVGLAHFCLPFTRICSDSLVFSRTLGFHTLSYRLLPQTHSNDGLVFFNFIFGFGGVELKGIVGIIEGNRQLPTIISNRR
jgi:hypothetical protein